MNEIHSENDIEHPPITELTSAQRRVLGVLVEKGFTTPEYYPLTLKAVTAGCSQKSNRSPVRNYSEDDVAEVLDELRELGLVAVVHTESGRTERYRHYMRRRFTFTEPQLAIMTELLLRGKQAIGELRSRASRMVPIDELDQLREELNGLQEMGFVQTSGSLERRGVLVDHNLYRPTEGKTLEQSSEAVETTFAPAARPTPDARDTAPVSRVTSSASETELTQRLAQLETAAETYQIETQNLRDEIDSLKETVRHLADQFEELRHDLGG